MDELTLEISPCEDSYYDKDGVIFLVTARVNEQTLADVLDVDEFFLSLHLHDLAGHKKTKAGKYRKTTFNDQWQKYRHPLFNCSCGAFGCGGHYVDVTCRPDGLVWENALSLDLEYRKRHPYSSYLFSWTNIRVVAGELLAAIYTAQAQSLNGEVRYGATGVEVTERLPFYLAQYELLPEDEG